MSIVIFLIAAPFFLNSDGHSVTKQRQRKCNPIIECVLSTFCSGFIKKQTQARTY